MAVKPCPAVKPGPGRVVLMKSTTAYEGPLATGKFDDEYVFDCEGALVGCLCPFGAGLRTRESFHGLRFASPVATARRPVGAESRARGERGGRLLRERGRGAGLLARLGCRDAECRFLRRIVLGRPIGASVCSHGWSKAAMGLAEPVE